MDAGGPGKLCQTADGVLHLSGRYHHQICQLVHHNDNLGHFLRLILVVNLFDAPYFLIVALEIADVVIRKQFVALCHLRNGPV